jgi:hypothetical protein
MNKNTMIVLPIVLVLFGSSVFAQNLPSNSASSSADAQRMMIARYRATHGQPSMYPPMTKEKIEKFMQAIIEIGLLYKMLEQPTMVSVDNGVVVAYGNTLRKYDKDLNVVKEVDLDVNVNGMQGLASRFAKKYSADFMDLMGTVPGSPNAPTSSTTGAIVPGPNKSFEDQKEADIKKEIDQMK